MRSSGSVHAVTRVAAAGPWVHAIVLPDLFMTAIDPSSMLLAGVAFVLIGGLVRRRRGRRTGRTSAGLA